MVSLPMSDRLLERREANTFLSVREQLVGMPSGPADRAQAIQIGAVLIFGILIVFLALYQAFVVPDQNEEIEFNHNTELQSDLVDLRSTVNSMPGTTTTQSSSVTLGVRYPSRAIFVNPGPVSGTLQTTGTTDDTLNLTIHNATADGNTGDYWNGTSQSYNTGAIEYRPSYNLYATAPRTVYEHSVVYNSFNPDTTLSLTDQAIISGDTITLVALNGSFMESRVDTASIDFEPVSTNTRTVRVGNESHNVTISVPTGMNESEWREVFEEEMTDNGGNVTGVNTTDIEDHDDLSLLEVDLEPGNYSLQLSKVGSGTGITETQATYMTDIGGDGATITAGQSRELVVEVRDEFNNPISEETVEGFAEGGEFADSGDDRIAVETDNDGQITVEYSAPSVTEDTEEKINFSFKGPIDESFDSSEPGNVTMTVTVQPDKEAGAAEQLRGPLPTNLTFASEEVPEGSPVEIINASFDNEGTTEINRGGTPVAAGEYYVVEGDVDDPAGDDKLIVPEEGTTPLEPGAGEPLEIDEPELAVSTTGEISTDSEAFEAGETYTVFLRGQDTRGIWTNETADDLEMGKAYNTFKIVEGEAALNADAESPVLENEVSEITVTVVDADGDRVENENIEIDVVDPGSDAFLTAEGEDGSSKVVNVGTDGEDDPLVVTTDENGNFGTAEDDEGTEFEVERVFYDVSNSDEGAGDSVELELRADNQVDVTENVVIDVEGPPTVETTEATNIGDLSATLNGDLIDLGSADEVDVFFEFREQGESTWEETDRQTLDSTGEFQEDVSDLNSGTTYEFRAVADGDGQDEGDIKTFRTDEGSTLLNEDITNILPNADEQMQTFEFELDGELPEDDTVTITLENAPEDEVIDWAGEFVDDEGQEGGVTLDRDEGNFIITYGDGEIIPDETTVRIRATDLAVADEDSQEDPYEFTFERTDNDEFSVDDSFEVDADSGTPEIDVLEVEDLPGTAEQTQEITFEPTTDMEAINNDADEFEVMTIDLTEANENGMYEDVDVESVSEGEAEIGDDNGNVWIKYTAEDGVDASTEITITLEEVNPTEDDIGETHDAGFSRGTADTKSDSFDVGDPADLQVIDVDPQDPVTEGENLDVEIVVENQGDLETTQDITLNVDNNQDGNFEIEAETVEKTVSGGDTETVTLIYTTQDGDEPEVDVQGVTEDDMDGETATATVNPQFEYTDDGEPETSGPGDNAAEVLFTIQSNIDEDATITDIEIDVTGNADRLDDGDPEVDIVAQDDGFRNDEGAVFIDEPINLDDTAVIGGGGTAEITLDRFEDEGGPGGPAWIDMSGEEITVTLYFEDRDPITLETREIDG